MTEFDFDFFAAPTHKEPNLEQVMEQVQNNSFQFDQFDAVDNENHQSEQSFDSHFFQPKEDNKASDKSKEDNRQFQFQNSRNISQISIAQSDRSKSFKYQNSPKNNANQLKPNERYQKLQRMLTKAKQNNLDMFYRNLDQQNDYYQQNKFQTREQFTNYSHELKNYKRKKQLDFKDKNGNYLFRNNHYQLQLKQGDMRNDMINIFGEQFMNNFKKKQTTGEAHAAQGNFLPAEYVDQEEDGVEGHEMKDEEIYQAVQKFKEKEYIKSGEMFFKPEGKSKQKKQRKPTHLESINEERANIFELTHQQEKMTKLLTNYQEMKNNFNDLMKNLKQTNGDQEKIITELKKLKTEYQKKESKLKVDSDKKKEMKNIKEKQKQQKNQKMTEIKDEITKMKQNGEKNLLFTKINQKIQNLQQIVKNAIQEMNEEKEQKFIPKIINYYQGENQNHHSSRNSRRSHSRSEPQFSREEQGLYESSQIGQVVQENLLEPVKNAIKQLKQQKYSNQQQFIDQFCSPLQLDLTSQDYPLYQSRNHSYQTQIAFVPPENSRQYTPNTLDSSNKYLRRCLTQKSSVVFESFQFYVTGKFTMTSNQRYPVLCEVRVANKCAINLYDIFVIVYGPQAQQSELQMRPSKIMYDEFKYNTSFLFEVDLSKNCLDNGYFFIQISYKLDSNKRKVNTKVILPFIQLIKPEFIYEEQFIYAWNHLKSEYYIKPKPLDFKSIRSHQDLKLILPLIQINQSDPNSFSYGIMFSYPKSTTSFMMKITCYVNGKASIHLKSHQTNDSVDKRLRDEVLDIMNFLCFG